MRQTRRHVLALFCGTLFLGGCTRTDDELRKLREEQAALRTEMATLREAVDRAGEAGTDARKERDAPKPEPARPSVPAVEEGTAQLNISRLPVKAPDGRTYYHGELEVFYRTPFASPPRLTFPDGLSGCALSEQKPGSFKLGYGYSTEVINPTSGVVVKWRAEGLAPK